MKKFFIGLSLLSVLMLGCNSTGKKNQVDMNQKFDEGSYGYDFAFLKENKITIVELKSPNSKACLLLAPDYQGRVMTSTASGVKGKSFGWINYKLIKSGVVSKQFNPVGGEERFWLGPEGGPFSIFFPQGSEQVFANWVVPPVLDTEKFEVADVLSNSVRFVKYANLRNASGTQFRVAIERVVKLLDADSLKKVFNVGIPKGLDVVAYRSDNKIMNMGEKPWIKETGLLSVWMLCMFNPSPTTTVFMPYKTVGEGTIVNDAYFGKVPPDRLKVEDGVVYFKIDGKLRSKIGLPPERAKEICGSYDSAQKILTLLWCTLPPEQSEYVNSQWGKQEDPFRGDAINSYNDGPVDGSILGPFYEIETSSPAAKLNPGQSLTHSQVVAHIQGDEAELASIVKQLFNLDLKEITNKFQ
jgi:hypothetical protein